MGFVVDASVAIKCLFVEAGSEQALQLFTSADLIAPDLLPIECRNGAVNRFRRGLLSREQAVQFQRDLDALALHTLVSAPLAADAFELALRSGETVYDCIYLALAIATERKLITADAKFLAAIRRSETGSDYVVPLSDWSLAAPGD